MIARHMSANSGLQEKSRVRFAIISDPHAVVGNAHRHETYARRETAGDPTRNPFAAVRALIEDSHSSGEEEPLRADALLCPGDLANRMDAAGLAYGWDELGKIAELLGAERIVATAGNHDVVRCEDLPAHADDDAWVGALRDLAPVFPTMHLTEAESYFMDDFTITEGKLWRVIALNSCALYTEPGQSWHGRIEEKTLAHITRKLNLARKEVNILMCHHHPVPWTHLAAEDTSHMQGGERLLRALENDDPARWIVLHGHRHVPALGYAGDTSSGPVRMSAGSLGISLIREARGEVRNQFYMLDFDLAETQALRLVGSARFRTWDWDLEHGMTPAGQSSELPGSGGFGFRRHAHDLAQMCRERAAKLGQRSVTWEELTADDPRWSYVTPRDLVMLRRVLEQSDTLVEPENGHCEIQRVSFVA